jgi:hypothetical protein
MSLPHPLRDITTAANNSATRASGFRSSGLAGTRKAPSSTTQDCPPSSPSLLSQPHYMMPTESSLAPSQQDSSQTKRSTPSQTNDSISKRKNWMSSASKRLGITSNKSRKAIPTISSPLITSPSPYSSMKRPEVSSTSTSCNFH